MRPDSLLSARWLRCCWLLIAWTCAWLTPWTGAGFDGAIGTTLLSIKSNVRATQEATYTVSGYVTDAESGETIVGATVYVPDRDRGTTTNQYGFFSLSLKADSVIFVFSHLSYTAQTVRIWLEQDLRLDVTMPLRSVYLDEVQVVADADDIVQAMQMSQITLPIQALQSVPALLGESDLLRVLQLLPGVASGREATSGIYVRGGGPDQNLILLDGVTVYNVFHLFGFLSAFNGDAIKDVALIKGGFPARYGGRLSSVVDITMKEGNRKEFTGSADAGIVAARATVEGPLRKDHASFLVSARRTYLDLLAWPLMPKHNKFGYNFYDVNAKVSAILSDRDRVYVAFYSGHDHISSRQTSKPDAPVNNRAETDVGWRNLATTARWTRILSSDLFLSVLGGYTRFLLRSRSESVSRLEFEPEIPTEYYFSSLLSGIADGLLRADLQYTLGRDHIIRAGAAGTFHQYNTGTLQHRLSGAGLAPVDTLLVPDQLTSSIEANAYGEIEVRIAPQLKVNAGLHLSAFGVGAATYTSVQPRFSLWWGLAPKAALKASYATMQQYVHLLPSGTGLTLPSDLWVPATERIQPQVADQVAMGIATTMLDDRIAVTLEGYSKRMRHVIEYKDGVETTMSGSGDWQDNVTIGRGWSYGIEVFVQKRSGRTTGWIGYTLSRSMRKFEHLNGGKPFPYTYDRLHDASVVVTHRLRPTVELSGTWVYGTGQALWLPIGQYYGHFHDAGDTSVSPGEAETLLIFGPRNSSRMPAYHRLDLAVRLHKERRHTRQTWSFGLYNAYNRRNAFAVTSTVVAAEDRGPSHMEFKKFTLFPIIPFATFRLEW